MAYKKVTSAKPKQKIKTVSKDKGSETEIQRFKWGMGMVGNLLQSLFDYKSQMEYRNSDFNANKSNYTKL